ncbi:hypothetical protein NQ315_017527 [Exocentrus adspersus]|uniref:G-protein coupled receptors family 3 profile domain-containing protein n=1 Tax=Exocentrus adspersus TaxID=1586481 RepID=A0AAV8VJA0_9CUCU|nr:hypothetical protein NQ315_017527 [Exocentrus adspersus]
MARTAVLLATFATRIVLSLTADTGRQTRFGNLDRGPQEAVIHSAGMKMVVFEERTSDSGVIGVSDSNSTLALERRLEMSTEFFLVPTSTTPSTIANHITKTACVGCPVEAERLGGVFRNEVWVIPVLALSAITMLLIACFEVFVLCKAWRTTPSRRHLFLGQMLLLGLFSCAGLAAVLAASPTQFTCAVIRFGTGVAYTIVFASLLVKCVFLISLNGGVYLPAPYQGLLLLFAILIQVAIGVQWLLTSPPMVDNIPVQNSITQNKHRLLVTAEDIINTPSVITLCRTPYIDVLLSLIYVIFLIMFVTVLAVKSRGIRDNYREATYIGLSIGCSIPTWLIWTTSGLMINERHRDACIAFGLVISSVMVFLIMFMPKGRQLAAMGKEGVYVEDREEHFSSLSRVASGYSPSFFHFKPIKYAINQGTSHKHHHTVTTLGEEYERNLRGELEAISNNTDENKTIEDTWREIKAKMEVTAKKCYKETKKEKKEWFDEQCKRELQSRKKLRLKMLQEGMKEAKNKFEEQRRKAKMMLRNKNRKHYEKVLERREETFKTKE